MVVDQWICDKCHEPIEEAEDGWLKWIKNLNTEKYLDFKIIHHPACRKPGPKIQRSGLTEPGDLLTEFTGTDGLIRLLELLAKTDAENQSGLLDVIQRIHVPGYETAREHFDKAHALTQIIPPIDGVYYLSAKKIQEINEQYSAKTK